MTSPSSSDDVSPVPGIDDDTDGTAVDRAAEDGSSVGTADAAEDARRAGADRDTPLRDTIEEGAVDHGLDGERSVDDGVPVGSADAEADRLRAGGDEG